MFYTFEIIPQKRKEKEKASFASQLFTNLQY